jgi:hypothetical protein
MSTSNERALCAAAAAANTNAGRGAVFNPELEADRAQHLAVAEAAATQAIEPARQAAGADQAAAVDHRAQRSAIFLHRRLSAVAEDVVGHLWLSRRCTRTPAWADHG